MLDISRVIGVSAKARCDSRGAHFREDFPDTGELDSTCFTRVHMQKQSNNLSLSDLNNLSTEMVPVSFDIVSPGESLIDDEAGLPPVASTS